MEQSIATTAVASADWVSISASGADFASDPEALLEKAVAEKRVWNLHAVVIVRYGRLVLERYFEGDDNARGRPLGKVVFSPMRRLRATAGNGITGNENLNCQQTQPGWFLCVILFGDDEGYRTGEHQFN